MGRSFSGVATGPNGTFAMGFGVDERRPFLDIPSMNSKKWINLTRIDFKLRIKTR